MHKGSSSFQNINKSIVLLLTIFCINMGYCAVQKIVSSNYYNKTEITKQPKTVVTSNSLSELCSSVAAEVSLLDIEKPSAKNISLSILLFSTILGLLASVLAEYLNLPRTYNRSLLSPIPLFLKNRTLII